MIKILIVFCIGLLLLAFPLFSDGMFMDGLIYAAIADNLSNGMGTWFNLFFSKTVMANFHEHPPLAFWLESMYHYVLDGSILSERLYSFTMWVLNGLLLVKLWNVLKQPRHLSWVPLLLWMLLPEVLWAFSNNILENTMGVFVTLSVILYLKSLEKNRWLYVALFAVSLLLILLSKGFTGAFVLAFPMLVGMFWQKSLLLRTFIDSIVALLLLSVLLLSLVYISPAAEIYFLDYLNNQVKGSLENVQVVSFRGQVIIEYLNGLIIPLGIVLIAFLYGRIKQVKWNDSDSKQLVLVLILLSLCGVLPIMISMKQRAFYILTVYPFAVVALAMYIKPILILVDNWLSKHVFKKNVLVAGMVLSVGLAIVCTTFIGRDEKMIQDVYALQRVIPAGELIDICGAEQYNWALLGYLSRYAKLSLNQNEVSTKYYLRQKSEPDILTKKEYVLQDYVLEIIDPTTNPQ